MCCGKKTGELLGCVLHQVNTEKGHGLVDQLTTPTYDPPTTTTFRNAVAIVVLSRGMRSGVRGREV
jgi:hypothetical protein